ncbi:hypothetical protein TrCOL_g7657 [Triparma columacea]|uniref:Arsenite methyltransferase n=1 Tax=Triparma columacea TaxID=722753 RepID=A0A9W7GBS3_9STRA|nr:hypothetical protein TrCOL_g7657 [Triparma columacea]
MATSTATTQSVQDYYGKVLQNSDSLATNACTTAGRPPPIIRELIKNVSPEVISKYYGCGICIPDCLEGRKVVDLGSGSGRDVFIISQLVGGKGKVVGVDMTKEQLEVAREGVKFHEDKATEMKLSFGNVDFVEGYIEKFNDILPDDMKDGQTDVVVSNCVINLSPDKEAVLRDAYKCLKEGGELYFSDVYSDRRVPDELRKDETLWGECISGALYWNDFLGLAKKCGFSDPRLVEDSRISINNAALERKCGNIKFYSATYRLFKLPELESDCEDYGQAVIYKGTVPFLGGSSEHAFKLDAHHVIEKGKVFPVCGNTWRMLKETRFQEHFDYIGNFNEHYGIFDGCGKNVPFESVNDNGKGGGASGGGGCC